jgi:murein L,D-transpeptidase YcbB/YkuD
VDPGEQPGWSPDRVVEAMQGTESISVKVKRPIQLVLMYATASVMSNGEVHFFRDIMARTAVLEMELGETIQKTPGTPLSDPPGIPK